MNDTNRKFYEILSFDFENAFNSYDNQSKNKIIDEFK